MLPKALILGQLMNSPQNNDSPRKKSEFDGLSQEVSKIIRDPVLQQTIGQFRKNETAFRIIKGIGFSIALASGLFGYFLKANSEADDRKEAALTNIINEKKEFAQKINRGILEVRKTRYLIKYDCDNGKAASLYEQGQKRFLARDKLVESFNGVREVFDKQLFQTLLELTAFDESVTDVCAKNAPEDVAWVTISRKANEQIRASIGTDREKLTKISTGIWDNSSLRF
jgi:hypothetical protein